MSLSILVDQGTRAIMQGITGEFGRYHSRLMLEYGTRIVAGVTPGRGGSEVNGVPVYDSVEEALGDHPADALITMVPAPFVKDALFEGLDSGVRLIACLAEGVPVKDMMLVKKRLEETGCLMLGPNSPGVISPGKCLIGYMPGDIFIPGNVGIVSRSGTFSYQVAYSMSMLGIGQSSCVGIGGDPITGVGYKEILRLFEDDPDTHLIVLVGEIGRSSEEEAAEFIAGNVSKPVVGMILGRTAPPGKQLGHAGAIIRGGKGSYASKVGALEAAGVKIAHTLEELVALVREGLELSRGRMERGA